MLRRLLLALCIAFGVGAPALASAPAAVNTAYVDITPVGLPIVVEGRVVNYVFVSVRLWARAGTDVTELRTKEPEFRDALVRAGHRRPFVVAGDANRVDEAAVIRAISADAARIAGRPVFQRVEVTAQTPQRRVTSRR